MNKSRNSGKVALVTGGSRGVGAAAAIKFAREGFSKIIINYLENEEAARKTAAEIEKAGAQACPIAANLTDPDEIDRLFERIESLSGAIDVFVHSASNAPFKKLIDYKPNQFDFVMNIMVRAFVYCVQKAAPIMRDGLVVAISSAGSSRVVPGYGAIGPAKAALESAVRYFAAELGDKGIRVNAVLAGLISGSGSAFMPQIEKIEEFVRETSPAKRVGTAEDVANAIYMLSTSEAAWINGQIITADGGFSIY